MTPPLAPAAFNFAGDVAYRRARETPEAVATLAICADGNVEAWTCARIADRTRRFASSLAAAGLVKGDRVLLFMDRTPDWQVAMTACLHLGAIPVPCVTQVTAEEVAHSCAFAWPVAAPRGGSISRRPRAGRTAIPRLHAWTRTTRH